MKKVGLVFVLAVIVPSLVLAWLAVRSLRDQQFVLERQQSLLYQGWAAALAGKVEGVLADRQGEFGAQVDALLASQNSKDLAFRFDDALHAPWPLAEVGFAGTLSGNILSPACAAPP